MRVDALFKVTYGHSLELNRLTRSDAPDAVNFVSRTSKNNGVSARVGPVPGQTPAAAGTLSVALGGSVLETFLQPSPYLCGRDVAVLTPKEPMSEVELLWRASCIRANRFRYNYGRQANRTLAALELPDTVPGWAATQQIPMLAPPSAGPLPEVDTSAWKPFQVDTIFEVVKGVRENSRHLRPGPVPYVRGSRNSNGYVGRYQLHPRFRAGTITVAYNGSVGEAFYQPQPYCASDDINILVPNGYVLNANRALFICALLRLEKFRYNYGRKWRMDLLQNTVIRFPVTEDGAVDWGWVDLFMAKLPYSSVAGGHPSQDE